MQQIGSLKLCKTKEAKAESLEHCVSVVLAGREDPEDIKGKQGGGYRNNNQMQKKSSYNKDGEGGDFQRNRPYKQHNFRESEGEWKREDTEERMKLKQKALEIQKKVKMEKNESQKIRLILNVITPDNFDKKFGELRKFLFGDMMT